VSTVRVRAPGKVMLFGEYAVLEGATARVAAVEAWARASAHTPADAATYRVHGEVVAAPGPFVEAALATVEALPAAVWDLDSRAFSIECADGGRTKLGLGSSAAITVAAVGAGRALAGMSARPQDVLEPALIAHRAAQGGRGSGADVAASTLGGVVDCAFFAQAAWGPADALRVGDASLAVSARQVGRALPHLTLIFSGTSASTPTLVQAVMSQRHARPIIWDRALCAIADASDAGAAALDADDRIALAQAVRQGDRAMAALSRELGGGTALLGPLHALLTSLAGPACALKTTGAGGGDLYWLYGDTEAAEAEAAARIEAAGHWVLRLGLEPRGLVVETPGAE